MGRELIRKSVDGQDYEFQQFGADKALRLLTRLMKIIGEPMAIGVGALQGPGSLLDKNVDGGVLGKAVRALSEKLDEDSVITLVKEFVGEGACVCNGAKVIFNTHYEARLGHMFKVLKAALEVQYGDFFVDLKGSLGSPSLPTTQDKAT
jgi:hypothetical protein